MKNKNYILVCPNCGSNTYEDSFECPSCGMNLAGLSNKKEQYKNLINMLRQIGRIENKNYDLHPKFQKTTKNRKELSTWKIILISALASFIFFFFFSSFIAIII